MFGLRHLSERIGETIRVLRKGFSCMRNDTKLFGLMLTAFSVFSGLLMMLISLVSITGPPLEEFPLISLAAAAFFIVLAAGGMGIYYVGAERISLGSLFGVAVVIAGALFFNGDASLSEIPLVVSAVILGFAVTAFIAMLASPG